MMTATSIIFLVLILTITHASSDNSNELLKKGGYLLNPAEKTNEAIENELNSLKVSLQSVVSELKNNTNVDANVVGENKQPAVFEVGIVIKDKKQTRRIDFINWARQIGMRALALGKRYVGVSFELSGHRCRLYLFFVEESEIQGIALMEGRNELNAKIRDLFQKLKDVDKEGSSRT